MRKIMLSLMLILGATNAVADGVFIGIESPTSFSLSQSKKEPNNPDPTGDSKIKTPILNVPVYVLVDYKKMFEPELGLRGYAKLGYVRDVNKEVTTYFNNADTADNGTATEKTTTKTYNLTLGADALYNLNEKFGVFAGLALQCKRSKSHYTQNGTISSVLIEDDTTKTSSIDLNINAGLRVNITQKHGLEFILTNAATQNIAARYLYTF